MPLADLQLPERLLAGGGPSAPDPRVLRALATPLVGQFDPYFTQVMDDVVQLARQVFLATSPNIFAVSAQPSGGLEAVLNSLVVPDTGASVAIAGSPAFVAQTAEIVRRCGAHPVSTEHLSRLETRALVVPFIDPVSTTRLRVQELAVACHAHNVRMIVEATLGLAACELRVDDWSIDACVAGVDHAVGAAPGMTLVTYKPELHAEMTRRTSAPRTSYLDLLQLQAYWSVERLNHHTAPTSLVYALREALRLVVVEGLEERWQRHYRVGDSLRQGLISLGLQVEGDLPYSIVHLDSALDEARARRVLLDEFGMHITRVGARSWRLGLLGSAARADAVHRVITALEKALAA
jgi:alanine-glyoxylate transaminase/serine-glyoxylate transaminase/serine-pyruvate transaminase